MFAIARRKKSNSLSYLVHAVSVVDGADAADALLDEAVQAVAGVGRVALNEELDLDGLERGPGDVRGQGGDLEDRRGCYYSEINIVVSSLLYIIIVLVPRSNTSRRPS